MTEQMAIIELQQNIDLPFGGSVSDEASEIAIKALEEIQQYRAYKNIFESHLSKDILTLLSDKEEFSKWLERGKWIVELLEAKKNCGEDSDCSNCPFGQIEDRCILAELQIEGGNNGWIPCDKELPPQPKENPLLDNKPLELYLVSLGDEEYPFRAFWNGKSFTDGMHKLNVTAWQPLPEPYTPKGE